MLCHYVSMLSTQPSSLKRTKTQLTPSVPTVPSTLHPILSRRERALDHNVLPLAPTHILNHPPRTQVSQVSHHELVLWEPGVTSIRRATLELDDVGPAPIQLRLHLLRLEAGEQALDEDSLDRREVVVRT